MAKPKVQVLVDWNDDGDFHDANEDLTADIQDIAIDHLRDLQTDYANGRVLDIVLNNSDHKYSPPKGTITGLQPGRKAWVRAWYPFDSFTAGAATLIDARDPDEDGDWTWVRHHGAWQDDGSGNGIENLTADATPRIATLEFGDTDVQLACNFGRQTDTTDHGGLTIRFVDTSNYGYVRVTGSAIEVRKVVAGSHSTVLVASHTWNTSTTKFLVVWLHGANVRVYVDTTIVIDGTLDDAAINGGTKHGLYADDNSDHHWEDFGGYRSLFLGRTGSIHPRPRKGAEYCYIKAFDEFEVFKVSPARYHNFADTAGGNVEDMLYFALSSVGFSFNDSTAHFDTGEELVTDVGSATPADNVGLKAIDESMLGVLYRWQDEEDGFIYFGGDGVLNGEGRSHRTSAPHTTSKATYLDTHDGSNPAFTDLAWDDGNAGVENRIIARVTRSVVTAGQTLWTNEQAKDTAVSISFDAAETKDFIAKIKDSDGAESFTALVENTDYEANTLANGTGSDISSELTVTTIETTKFAGLYRKLRVVFGATPGFLTLLQQRGAKIELQDPSDLEDGDATSQGDYGERRKTIDCLFIDRDDVARTMLASRLARRKDPKTVLDLTLRAGDKATLHNMIQRQMSDRVTVTYSDMGISEDFFIEGESWRISEGGTDVEQVLQLRGV